MPEQILTFKITPTLDTNIYADGDLLFDSVEVSSALAQYSGYIAGIEVLDKGDQKAGMDIVFQKENRAAGSLNSAPTITDDHGEDRLGVISVAADVIASSGDYVDHGGSSSASKPGENIAFGPGMTGLYMYGICRGSTPTFGASSLVITVKLHLLQ